MLLIIISIIPSIVISQEYCNFIEKVQNYQDSAKVISVKYKSNAFHIVDTNTFKTRTYLSFFDKIENEKGFRIRMYYFGGRDGNPYLYALKKNEKLNYNRRYNLYKVLNKPDFRAKNHIKPAEDSELGFLQYLFFSEMGELFTLKWHSLYDDKEIICSSDMFNRIIKEHTK